MGRLISTKTDLAPVNRLATLLRQKGEDLDPLLSRVAEAVRESNRHQFDSAGDGKWQPLQARTAAMKSRRGFDSAILVRTGALKRSLTQEGALGSVLTMRSNGELVVGTSIPYAKNHQLGLGNNPRRVIIEADEALIDSIQAIAGEYLYDL